MPQSKGKGRSVIVRRAVAGLVLASVLCALLAAYLGLKTQRASADSSDQGIDVGLLQVPVTFDGKIDAGEYSSDTIDYKFYWAQIFEPQTLAEGHLYAKYSDFVYFGIDIPIPGTNTHGYNLNLVIDTNNTGAPEGSKEEGIYNLYLYSSSLEGIPNEVKDDEFGTGTPFSKGLGGQFTKGEDYNWAYRFGPSPLNENDHPQFEIKISTDILMKYSNEIGLDIAFVDDKGFLTIPQGKFWEKMRFTEQVIPELTSPQKVGAAAFTVTAGAIYAVKRISRRPMTRRELLGFRWVKARRC